jgi:hypothetical protein
VIGFLAGAVTIAYLVSAGFFFQFWRKTSDRLFLAFACAFSLFAVNQALVDLLSVVFEPQSFAYVLRILGFVLILAAILDKNLGPPRRPMKPRSRGVDPRR